MFFTDTSESLSVLQLTQPERDSLVAQPLLTESFLNALPPNLSEEQLAAIAFQLEAEAITPRHYQPDSSLAGIQFSPSPIITSLQGDGKQTVTGIAADLTGVDFADTSLSVDPIHPAADTIRINAGGKTYLDALGQTWLADQYFSDGLAADTNSQIAKTNSDISETQNDVLYQSERYAKNMNYYIPVANGIYDVNLHLANQPSIHYITPNGSGDGSSWERAARISDLDALIEQSSPGDEIWLAGDLGTYHIADQTIRIDSGGSAIAPIYIRGMASQTGGNDTPLFVGDRAEDWAPGKANGHEVFRLLDGADHLHFSGLDFKNVGNGAFRLGGDLTDITLEDMEANNVRRFVENSASNGASTASVSGLTIRDVDVKGFSKNAIRLQYNTHDVLIEDVFGDSQGQDGDRFAMGVHLSGSVNNVVHRRVTMNNAIQTKDENSYWNADGFVTEKDTYNIIYEDTYAAGNTDGGYDLKSHNTLLIRAGAADNKRNFRIWGSAIMHDVVSDDPLRRGGIGTDAHIHVLGNGTLTIEGGTFTGDQSIDNIIFDLDDEGSLVVHGAVITDDLYTLHTVQNGNIQLEEVLEK